DAFNAGLKNIPLQTTAGPHQLAVTFVQRSFAEYEGILFNQTPIDGANVIRVNSFEIQGPFQPAGLSETPARQRLFSCYPQSADQETACAREIIATVARRAFRGALSDSDLTRLLAVYERAREEAGFELGIRRALTAVLASPRFLYRL